VVHDVPDMDAVVLFNVLEHVDDPVALLRAARRTLQPKGRLILLVPALPSIYGTLDTAFGHLCRYDAATIVRLVEQAGYHALDTRYLNSLGVAPWFVLGRILRQRTLGRFAVRLYDALAIPLLARLERSAPPPFGQSLFVVAEVSG
jgi:SAM-dependent methyltransferase